MEHADLMGIGQHCSVPHCQQLDFLPFTCDCCNKIYCLDHRTYSAHSCPNSAGKQLEVLPCPICAKGIHLKAGEDANVVFDRHYGSPECDPANYARVMKKKKCPVPGCKEKLTTINTYTCKTCTQKVCLKHRLEIDHKCPGKSAHPLVQRQAASMAQAAAAAGRSISSRATSLWADMVASTTTPTPAASAPGSNTGRYQQQAAVHNQQLQLQLQQRAAQHQAARQQQQQQQQQPQAAAVPQDPSNTLYGSAERRRQQLGLPARQREICPQCGRSFAALDELIQHAEAAHGNSSSSSAAGSSGAGVQQPQHSAAGADVFACPTCSREFIDAALLVAHSEQCSNAQQNACVMC